MSEMNSPPPEKQEPQDNPLEETSPENLQDESTEIDPQEESSSAEEPQPDTPESWQEEARLANERVLRVQAELENFRKRSRREMEAQRRYATLPLINDLLSIVDNLQRAMEAAEENTSASGLLEGVKMVSQQFDTVLSQYHCVKIEALGALFDPNIHEAVFQEPSDEHPAQSVARVMTEGYRLHDRVIRPSQVSISTGPPATDESAEEN